MAKKNIYSELIKNANRADFLSVQNDGERVEIVTSHWVFSTSTEQYRLTLANELKGFPVVADGECYARNTVKGKVGRKEPFNTARVIADAVADAVAVKPTSFIYEIAEATHRVVVSDNAEVILLINDGGLVTLTEVLATMLDNERNEAIQEALEWIDNYQKQKKMKGVAR